MKSIALFDVYTQLAEGLSPAVFLYDLLAERDPVANISHREMPTFDQHRKFLESVPYKRWYLIGLDGEWIGSVYLTNANEIGVSILKAHQGNGYGKQAVYLLMKRHPEKRFLANIAPGNARSAAMFEGLGFTLFQHTFELRQKC
jgi:RimJ/RimL family protein N-acetyltransferase